MLRKSSRDLPPKLNVNGSGSYLTPTKLSPLQLHNSGEQEDGKFLRVTETVQKCINWGSSQSSALPTRRFKDELKEGMSPPPFALALKKLTSSIAPPKTEKIAGRRQRTINSSRVIILEFFASGKKQTSPVDLERGSRRSLPGPGYCEASRAMDNHYLPAYA